MQAKQPSAKQQWECTKYVLKTHFSVELPQVRGLGDRRKQQQKEEQAGLTLVIADLPVPPARGHGRHEDLGGAVPVVLDPDGAPGASRRLPV